MLFLGEVRAGARQDHCHYSLTHDEWVSGCTDSGYQVMKDLQQYGVSGWGIVQEVTQMTPASVRRAGVVHRLRVLGPHRGRGEV